MRLHSVPTAREEAPRARFRAHDPEAHRRRVLAPHVQGEEGAFPRLRVRHIEDAGSGGYVGGFWTGRQGEAAWV